MGQAPLNQLVAYLLPQIPYLGVCIAAIVLAVLNWNRHRLGAHLVLSGAVLLLVSTIVFACWWSFMVSQRPVGNIGFQLRIGGLVNAVLHAIGMGLIVAAVFAGRNPLHARRGFDVRPPLNAAPPPLPSTESRG